MIEWFLIAAVLIACPIVSGVVLARSDAELERLGAAVQDFQAAFGKPFVPAYKRLAGASRRIPFLR